MGEEKKCLKVCETCPWLKKNHGKEHPDGWYKTSNIKRIWNGLRTGRAPGVICHSTDADQADYGGVAKINPETKKQECAGALLALGKHVTEVNETVSQLKEGLKAYQARHALPLTKTGLAVIFERQVFGGIPPVEDRRDEVGLPWDKA